MRNIDYFPSLKSLCMEVGYASQALDRGAFTTETFEDWIEQCLSADGGPTFAELKLIDTACSFLTDEEKAILSDGETSEREALIQVLNDRAVLLGYQLGDSLEGILQDVFEWE